VGFLDYYKQFRALPPEEVSRRLRERAEAERRVALERVPPLDLSDTTWHEPPHAEAVNLATYALRRAVHRYTETSSREVREAAAEFHGVEPGQVAVGHGAGELLLTALHRIAHEREVVVPWPAWLLAPVLVRRAGGEARSVALGPGGAVDPRTVLDAVDERTAAVLVASPNDPTGLRTDVEAIRAGLPRHVWLLVDEALGDWLPRPGEPPVAVGERVLRVRSFSKAHAMAGLRAGYVIGPEAFVRELAPPQGIGAPAEAAMTWALREGAASLARRRDKALAERRRLAEALRGSPFSFPPSETSFVWLSSRVHSGAAIAAALGRRQLYVAPGGAWGDDRHVRLALRDEAATLRVVQALEELDSAAGT
jgi:histidinol-phosphate/aromatic aminotransferase/cobyric acid decarboxylase-like protein